MTRRKEAESLNIRSHCSQKSITSIAAVAYSCKCNFIIGAVVPKHVPGIIQHRNIIRLLIKYNLPRNKFTTSQLISQRNSVRVQKLSLTSISFLFLGQTAS